ncbi:hypothetical protein [Bacillus sp. SG-1]|uniref:hypothetical protein n=1 Tax=Bacillus sp. SG-1 TaxID=161544 RepID=UPI00015446B1|nr:hypothetical protein [Bacillus sp. SG-1]EDL63492.1 hypothetical protein BSG1_09838 [Bacillus sp. SG-1]
MNLYFLIPTYTEGDSTFPKPVSGDYKYWFSLISAFLKKSDTIEIHCWNEEIDTVEEIVSLKQGFKKINEENLTIFKGKVTSIIIKFILNNYCNKQGELKWFTLNLYKNCR